MEPSELQVLSAFLKENSREDLKVIALHEILGLSGSKEGCCLLEDHELGKALIECLKSKNEAVYKTACLSLVNLSASESGTKILLDSFSIGKKEEIIMSLVNHIMDPESSAADAACMTLSNLTRQCNAANLVVENLNSAKISIEKLINLLTKKKFNTKGCNLNYLGPLFSNLSQNNEFRKDILNKEKCIIKKLLPFTQFQDSLIRRGGIVGTLKNCCFETDFHEWLLGSDVDILPSLLLPLAGPEEFDEEENDKLPIDLQYLGDEKEREPDEDIRKMLLEALHQLCATKFGREYFREKNVYVILREYHKWEENRSILLACENIVDILIRTEEEINENNLKEIEVPSKYFQKFEEMDREFLKDS